MDRAAFFAAVRAEPFGKPLQQGQVDGMTAILDKAPAGFPQEHLAYCLATAFHETARSMQPIKEIGGHAYFTRMYDPQGARKHVAKALGNIFPGDGAKFAGRGFVQITGRSNYARAAGITGEDLVDNPDLAMRCDLAARIMFEGMTKGWFTGKKLADYFDANTSDPVNARRIINGTDRAQDIAAYHKSFLRALVKAEAAAVAPAQPIAAKPPDLPLSPILSLPAANPLPPAHMVEPAPKGGGFSLSGWWRGLFGRAA